MRIRYLQNLIEIQAPAKVNLFLEILGRREDGFHQLETVISSVSIYDTVRFSPRSDDQICFHVSGAESRSIPADESNLIVRALNMLRDRFDLQMGADISIQKRIPAQAGLGGGSSNAAAGLIAGASMWNVDATPNELSAMAAELGSDVPFFLQSGTCLCSGRGEKIQSVPTAAGWPIVIAMPPTGLDTAQVFRQHAKLVDTVKSEETRSAKSMLQSLRSRQRVEVGRKMFNRLQESASQLSEWIVKLATSFSQLSNCLGHQMSGSGSSYFGLFSNRLSAQREAKRLSCLAPNARIFVGCTLGSLVLGSGTSELATQRSTSCE